MKMVFIMLVLIAGSVEGIKDVVVVGIPNKKFGEVVAAYISSDIYKSKKDIEPLLEKVLLKKELPYLLIIDGTIPLLSNGKHDIMKIRSMFIGLDEKN